jgi:hypothetical protein
LAPHIYGLPHYQHSLPEWYICYNWWAYKGTLLLSKKSQCILGFSSDVYSVVWTNVQWGVFSIIQSSFSALKIFYAPSIQSFPILTLTPGNQWIFYVTIVLPFPECHIIRIMKYVVFENWLLLLSSMHLSFLHILSWLDSPLFEWPIVYPSHIAGHLGCFQVLVLKNKPTINICVQVFVHTSMNISFQLLRVNTKKCNGCMAW